jgi:hypothetical protein
MLFARRVQQHETSHLFGVTRSEELRMQPTERMTNEDVRLHYARLV